LCYNCVWLNRSTAGVQYVRPMVGLGTGKCVNKYIWVSQTESKTPLWVVLNLINSFTTSGVDMRQLINRAS
jgi:hypothetical protein